MCLLEIVFPTTTYHLEKASWYEIWEATVAISSVCARRSLVGSMPQIGKSYDPYQVNLD